MDTMDSDVTMCSDVEKQMDAIVESSLTLTNTDLNSVKYMTPRKHNNERLQSDKHFEFEIRKTRVELKDPKEHGEAWGRDRLRPRKNPSISQSQFSDYCLISPTQDTSKNTRRKTRKLRRKSLSSSISDISCQLAAVTLNNKSKADARYGTATRGRPRKKSNSNISKICGPSLVLGNWKQNTDSIDLGKRRRGKPRKNASSSLSDILSPSLVLDNSKQDTCCLVDLVESGSGNKPASSSSAINASMVDESFPTSRRPSIEWVERSASFNLFSIPESCIEYNDPNLVTNEASHDKTHEQDQQMKQSETLFTTESCSWELFEKMHSHEFESFPQWPEQANNIEEQSDFPKFDDNESVSSVDMPMSLLSGSSFCLISENKNENSSQDNNTQHRYPLRSLYCSQIEGDYFGTISVSQKDKVSPAIEGCLIVKRQLKDGGALPEKTQRPSSQKKKLGDLQDKVENTPQEHVKTFQQEKVETPQLVKVDNPQEGEVDTPQEVELDTPQEVELDTPQEVEMEIPQEVEVDTPQEKQMEIQQDEVETPQPQLHPIWSSETPYQPCYRLLSNEEMDAQLDITLKLVEEWKVRIRQRLTVKKQEILAEVQEKGLEKYQIDMQLCQMETVRDDIAGKAKRDWNCNFERIASSSKETNSMEGYNRQISGNDADEYIELSSSDSD